MEKELAHDKRDRILSKQLDTLERDFKEGKLHNKRQLYKRLKASYRAPPEAMRAILEVLSQSGWSICSCLNQSDTCIARAVNNAAVPGDIRVITKDSDFMAFESIMSVTMPVKDRWTTFYKQELLNEHALPSPVHLTLAAMISNNDYTDGVFSYGLKSNIDMIRQFDMAGFDGTVGQDRVEVFQGYVRRYLDIIHQKARTNKDAASQSARRRLRNTPNPTVKAHNRDLKRIEMADRQLRVDATEFNHALKVFVLCEENTLKNSRIGPAADAHTRLMAIIGETETEKAFNDWRRFSASRTGSLLRGPQVDPASQEAVTHAQAVPPPPPTEPRSGSPSSSQNHGPAGDPSPYKPKKKQRRHGSRAHQRRRRKWHRSR